MDNILLLIWVVLLLLKVQSTIASEITNTEQNVAIPDDGSWIVETKSGPVQGKVISTVENLKLHVFYGVPYAEPPVGKLRFKPPTPIEPWTEVFKATKKPLPCYQLRKKASMFRTRLEMERVKRPWTEDCLNINIWVPISIVENVPVLVSFHPGMFEYGSNNDPEGSIVSAKSEVIVVSMNYRLAPFGFLNLGTPESPGNMGLLDQQLALKWIHENIPHFGGLQETIILAGPGNAGAASVGYHLLSPGSAAYFAAVTAISGSPVCPWAFQERHVSLKNSKLLSKRLGCHNNTSEDELDCLRHAHPEDIIDATTFLSRLTSLDILPTVDGSFITESPLKALKSGNFKKTYMLYLSNKDEGSLSLRFLNDDVIIRPELGLDMENFRTVVNRILPNICTWKMNALEEFFVGKCDHENHLTLWNAAVKVYSDVLFDCCSNLFLDLFVGNGGHGYLCVDSVEKASNPTWAGSWHASNADVHFGFPLLDDGFSEPEKNLTAEILIWIKEQTRFMNASKMEEEFVPYDIHHKNYTYWDRAGGHYYNHYKTDQCSFWNDISPTDRCNAWKSSELAST